MTFQIKDSGNKTYDTKDNAQRLINKVVTYDEDWDYIDPSDPDEWEYTLPFDCHTVRSMLESLPNGVRWNPRSEQFEGPNGTDPWA